MMSVWPSGLIVHRIQARWVSHSRHEQGSGSPSSRRRLACSMSSATARVAGGMSSAIALPPSTRSTYFMRAAPVRCGDERSPATARCSSSSRRYAAGRPERETSLETRERDHLLRLPGHRLRAPAARPARTRSTSSTSKSSMPALVRAAIRSRPLRTSRWRCSREITSRRAASPDWSRLVMAMRRVLRTVHGDSLRTTRADSPPGCSQRRAWRASHSAPPGATWFREGNPAPRGAQPVSVRRCARRRVALAEAN